MKSVIAIELNDDGIFAYRTDKQQEWWLDMFMRSATAEDCYQQLKRSGFLTYDSLQREKSKFLHEINKMQPSNAVGIKAVLTMLFMLNKALEYSRKY
jgi:hypothetical protein